MRYNYPFRSGSALRTAFAAIAMTLLLNSTVPASQVQGSKSTPGKGLTGLALGGIGAGTFRLMSDGSIGEATLYGNWDCPTGAFPGCFAAIRTHESTRTRVNVLALNSAYHLPTVKGLRGERLSPQMRLDVADASLPISVSMLAFSPLVPFDIRNSSFPAATMVLQLHNSLPVPVEVSIALSWESMLGMTSDGLGHPVEDRTGISASVLPSADGFFGVRFSRSAVGTRTGSNAETKEEMELLAYPQVSEAKVTTAIWDAQSARPAWWERFAQTGDVSGGVDSGGAHPAAVVAIHLTLKPNDYASIPCAVSWYLPHLERNGQDVGRYYQKLFTGADEVGRTVLADWLSLHSLTEEWQQRLTFSNLPRWLVGKLISSTETLTTNSLLTRDGRFEFVVGRSSPSAVSDAISSSRPSAREGLATASLLLAFFPRLASRLLLDKSREIGGTADAPFLLPSRTPSNQSPANAGIETDPSETIEADAVFLLQLAEYVRWTGDEELLRDTSATVQKVLRMDAVDPGEGIKGSETAGQGPALTVPIRTLILQLAGLRAGRILAIQLGTEDLARSCERRAQILAARIEKERWNGNCYGEGVRSALLPPQGECETDQLLGQGAADQISLGMLLTTAHMGKTLHSLLSTAEAARSAHVPTSISVSDLWLGIAIPALCHGLAGESLALLEREAGGNAEAGEGMNPQQAEMQWQERAAPWSVLNALAGVQIDMKAGKMALLPNLPGLWRSLLCPIFAPTFWGLLDYKPNAHGGLLTLRVSRILNIGKGERDNGSFLNRADLTLTSLQIPGPPLRIGGGVAPTFAVYVSRGRVSLGAKSALNSDGTITLTFDTPLRLSAGDRLTVDLH